MRHTRHAGFSLIELMIVVVIIAILATIAVPGYQRYIRNAERDFATTWLSEKDAAFERIRMRTGDYPRSSGTLDLAAIGEAITGTSATTFYLSRRSGLSTSLTGTSRYKVDIIAGPNGNRPALQMTTVNEQTADTTCAQLTLNANGSRSATSKSGNDTTTDCWR